MVGTPSCCNRVPCLTLAHAFGGGAHGTARAASSLTMGRMRTQRRL